MAKLLTVADPRFELRGCVDFVNGGGACRKSSKVLQVEVNHFIAILAIFFIKIILKINRERSERCKNSETLAFWA